MSPEQAQGLAVDPRSDIFSLGSILYEAVTGERAFRGETSAATLAAILKEEPAELANPSGRIPPGLERIVKQCLEKRPEHRFHSAHDLGLALEAVSGASGTRTVATPVAPRKRLGVLVLAAALLAATTAAFFMGKKGGRNTRAKLAAAHVPSWDRRKGPILGGRQLRLLQRTLGREA